MQESGPYATIVSSSAFLNKSFEKCLEDAKSQPAKKAVVTTVAGDGTQGYANGPALTAKFKSPLDVAVTADGTIYVADGFNSCIRKITGSEVITFAGNGNANIKNGSGSNARFKIPSRLAADIDGNLFVSDAADPRIRKITSAGLVSTYAGINMFGLRDGDVSDAQFGQSFGITTDTQNNIYIADSQNDCIRKISFDKQVITIAGAGSKRWSRGDRNGVKFRFLKGLVIDNRGNLFAADFNRIYKITAAGVISTFAVMGIKTYSDEMFNSAKFYQIEDMAMDEQANIYLTEAHRILKINPGGSVSVLAGSIPGYKDGYGESAKFNEPKGLGIDKRGNIYVADSNNNRIRKISFE